MPEAQARKDFAQDVVVRLRRAGFQALWAGGCVRDILLGLTPVDYDVATSATPEQVMQTLPFRTITVGISFGVVRVRHPRNGAIEVEVATFRIAVEAISNVVRHSGARACRVRLGADSGAQLVVEVCDDGAGAGPWTAGVGMLAMRERTYRAGCPPAAVRRPPRRWPARCRASASGGRRACRLPRRAR